MASRCIGILVAEHAPPFQEKQYYKQLTIAASQFNILMIVFSATDIDWDANQIKGYSFSLKQQAWIPGIFPLPDIIYDRTFFNRSINNKDLLLKNVKRLREMKPPRMLGNPLSGKWSMHGILNKHEVLAGHLPKTDFFHGKHSLAKWLCQKKCECLFKPVNGSQGRGVFYVNRTMINQFEVKGRDEKNRIVHKQFSSLASLYFWIRSFTQGRPYLIQQFLDLSNRHGNIYDVRALVQKDDKGQWNLTGTAVRVGIQDQVTTNLHGGGKAVPTVPFLAAEVGSSAAGSLYRKISELSSVIPPYLEGYFGRLAELGIDYGIDRDGRIWILEVNSKPGRAVFGQSGDHQTQKRAIRYPVFYARYLVDRQLGG